MSLPVRVLYNPASGRGRGARMIGRIRTAFAEHGITDVRGSRERGDEARLVHEAIADGVETIVVAGGDGTWHHAGTALARAGSPARMAFLAAGTGNDFAKNLRAPAHDPVRMAALVAAMHGAAHDATSRAVERRVDLGRVDDQWFLNCAGFGFDVAVLRASQGARLLRGPALYAVTALRELLAFEGIAARVDGTPGRSLLSVFSNGHHFGGAFHIAPGALVDDGALDAILVADVRGLARLPLLARAMRGAHVGRPGCRHERAGRFTLQLDGPTWFEADGELYQTRGATAEVVTEAGALRVLDEERGAKSEE